MSVGPDFVSRFEAHVADVVAAKTRDDVDGVEDHSTRSADSPLSVSLAGCVAAQIVTCTRQLVTMEQAAELGTDVFKALSPLLQRDLDEAVAAIDAGEEIRLSDARLALERWTWTTSPPSLESAPSTAVTYPGAPDRPPIQ